MPGLFGGRAWVVLAEHSMLVAVVQITRAPSRELYEQVARSIDIQGNRPAG